MNMVEVGIKKKNGLWKSEKVMFFFFFHYLLAAHWSEKRLEIFIFLKKHRDAKVKPKKRLLMEECILMDVEQVTSNRCAQISRVRHENRWWDLKMSKLLDQ